MELRNEALRLAAWHEERAREVEMQSKPLIHHTAGFREWLKLDEIREYHDATAKTLRKLAEELGYAQAGIR